MKPIDCRGPPALAARVGSRSGTRLNLKLCGKKGTDTMDIMKKGCRRVVSLLLALAVTLGIFPAGTPTARAAVSDKYQVGGTFLDMSGTTKGSGWNWNGSSKTLTFTANTTISATGVQKYKMTPVGLPSGSTIVVNSGVTATLNANSADGIFCEGALTIKGTGTLYCYGSTSGTKYSGSGGTGYSNDDQAAGNGLTCYGKLIIGDSSTGIGPYLMVSNGDTSESAICALNGKTGTANPQIAVYGGQVKVIDPRGTGKIYCGSKNRYMVLYNKAVFEYPAKNFSYFGLSPKNQSGNYFYAQTQTYYTVTYNVDGATFLQKQVLSGDNADLSVAPSKSGYDFVGWNTSSGATSGLSSLKVTGATTLYAVFKKQMTPVSNLTVTLSPASYTYDGSAKTPAVAVKNGDTALTQNTHYTVSYSNNVNAGTATATITGVEDGGYSGSVTKNFTIQKASITPSVALDDWTYGEDAKTPVVTGNPGGGTTSFQYKSGGADDAAFADTVPSAAGAYVVRAQIAETDNYNSGEARGEFQIVKAASEKGELSSLTSAEASPQAGAADGSISGVDSSMEYSDDNGATWKPVEGERISGLPAGVYQVRFQGDENHDPGTPVTVTVGRKTEVRHIVQNVDGSWPDAETSKRLEAETVSGAAYEIPAAPKGYSEGFRVAGYSYGDVVSTDGETPASAGERVPLKDANGYLYVYYARNQYDLVFYSDAKGETVWKTETPYYGAPLDEYEPEYESELVKDNSGKEYRKIKPDGKNTLPTNEIETFGGWASNNNNGEGWGYYKHGYTDTITAPELTFIGKTMPAETLRAYPIMVANAINVRLDLGAYDEYNNDKRWYNKEDYDSESPAHMEQSQGRSFWKYTSDETATVDMNYMKAATRKGYALDGWYSQNGALWNPDNRIARAFGDRDENGELLIDFDPEFRNHYYTLTLTAHWKLNKTTVSYDAGTGSGAPTDGAAYDPNSAITVPANPPTPPDGGDGYEYRFLGWRNANVPETIDDGNGAQIPNPSLTLYAPGSTFVYSNEKQLSEKGETNNIRLVAVYRKVPTGALVFDSKGGSVIEPIERDVGETVTAEEIAALQPEREGYTFAGWKDGDTPFTGPYTMETGGKTVSADWTANPYTITLNAPDTALETTQITAAYGAELTPPDNPTRTGYAFKGWSPAFPETMPVTPPNGLTLMATWEINNYTVTWDANGGSQIDSVTQNYRTWIDAPESPVKSGCTFNRWIKENGDTVSFPFLLEGNATLKAVWYENQETPAAPKLDELDVQATEITIKSPPAGQEYSIDGGEHWVKPTDGQVVFPNLTPGAEYTVQTRLAVVKDVNAEGGKNPSGTSKASVTTPKKEQGAPETAPILTATDTAITVDPADKQQEYSIDGENWLSLPAGETTGTVVFANLNPNKEYTVAARMKETETQKSSTGTVTTSVTTAKSPNTTKPNAPSDITAEINGITVGSPASNSGYEYSLSKDGENWGEWQSGNAFDNLEPDTVYYVHVRHAETNTANPSPASDAVAVRTAREKEEQDAPTALTVTKASADNAKDGAIHGVTDEMEYSADDGETWTTVPSGMASISGLAPGSYQVRFKETEDSKPGDSATITVEFKGTQDAPTALTVTKASAKDAEDGAIGGVDDTMEYSADGGGTWTPVPSHMASISGLAPGSYQVRARGTDDDNPSLSAVVEVGVVNAPLNLTVKDASGLEAADGIISGVDDTMEHREHSDDDSGEWKSVDPGANEITGLQPGDYDVRVRDTGDGPSDTAVVTIEVTPEAPATPAVTKKPSGADASDGEIGGVDETM
ncbi:MAG: InlB B-repeat-containing protein [Oscillibacter sp.]|nr:InlB B-repeat-containing protein [Oscillibacter sp.]